MAGEGTTYTGSVVHWQLATPSKKVSAQWLEALQRAKLELHELESIEHLTFITDLVVRMKSSIQVCDRFHYLKPYKRCFLGDEAVAWIMQTRDCTLNEALMIGANMINLGLIYHVKREHFLCNKAFFYRFNPSLEQLVECLECAGVFQSRCSCSANQEEVEDALSEARSIFSIPERIRSFRGLSSRAGSATSPSAPPAPTTSARPSSESSSDTSLVGPSTPPPTTHTHAQEAPAESDPSQEDGRALRDVTV